MGYAVYEDSVAHDRGVERWAGYGVPAVCDFADCEVAIDRGMDYRCEEYTVYRYFDEQGNECPETADWCDERDEQLEGCGLHFCVDHSGHEKHGDNVTPKPDTAEWVSWLLTDESWEEWRSENGERVEAMRTRTEGAS